MVDSVPQLIQTNQNRIS